MNDYAIVAYEDDALLAVARAETPADLAGAWVEFYGPRVRVREERVDLGGVGDVERRHDCRLAAGRVLLQCRTPAAGKHDLPAVIQQRLGGRAADARPGAGDDRDLTRR
jgi:hypothetical protein